MRRPRNYMLLTDEQIEALPENLQPLAHVVFDRRIIPLLAPMWDEQAADLYGEEHDWEHAWVAWDVMGKQWVVACPACGSAFTTGFGGDGFGGSSGYGYDECDTSLADNDWDASVLDTLPRMITTTAERHLVYDLLDVYNPDNDRSVKS